MERPTARDFDKGDIKTAFDAINRRNEYCDALNKYIDHLDQQQVKKLNIDDVSNCLHENQALDEIMNEGDIIHIVSNTEGKLFCSMTGKGFCPYEKQGGECIMEDPCKNHTTK